MHIRILQCTDMVVNVVQYAIYVPLNEYLGSSISHLYQRTKLNIFCLLPVSS